jgi:hypothetical protein
MILKKQLFGMVIIISIGLILTNATGVIELISAL